MDEKFIDEANIKDYIDSNLQYEKVIEQPIKIISDAIDWEIKKTSNLKGFF